MTTPTIIFDEKTFPDDLKVRFAKDNYLEIWTNYELPLLYIWDLELYLFFKIQDYPNISYSFYPNGLSNSRLKNSGLTPDYVSGKFYEFYKGYKDGYNPNNYKAKLNHKLYDIIPTNEVIKTKVLELREEIGSYLKFYGVGLDDILLADLGNRHGLYTRISERIHEHRWEEEREEKIVQRPLSEDLKEYFTKDNEQMFLNLEKSLIRGGYLNNMDYTFKLKSQVVAFAFIIEDKKLIEVASYPKFEKIFGDRFSIVLNNDFAPSRKDRKLNLRQINNLNSCFRSLGVTGF